MRAVEWLFAVSATLFVVGIGFVVVGARTARLAPGTASSAPPSAPNAKPIASVRQIMLGMVEPAATVVFESVSTTVTKDGIDEKVPKTDADWQAVAASAAVLGEAGQLLMADGRAIDRRDWNRFAELMVTSAREAIAAVEARSAAKLFDAGGAVYTSCDGCHQQYMR